MIKFKIIFSFLIICIINSIVISSENEVNINNNFNFINKYNQKHNNNNNQIIINDDYNIDKEYKNSNNVYKHLTTNNTNTNCNQNLILKDWGFPNLYLAYQNNNISVSDNLTTIIHSKYWSLSYPFGVGINISFVDQLEEAFFSNSIQGYSAIKISSLPGKPLSTILANVVLNQTFEIDPSNSYLMLFEISSTEMVNRLLISINSEMVLQLEPTGSTFARVPYQVMIESSFLEKVSTLSIELIFFNQGFPIPPTYIENIRFIKLSYKSLLSTVYVSNNGSDVTGDGTLNNPFSSIQQATYYLDRTVNATIIVLPGYYCGFGNCYLDFSNIPSLILTTLDSQNAIISGEYYTTSVLFSTVKGVNLLISNINFIKSSIRSGGSSIEINGNCTLHLQFCEFDLHYGDSVLLLNYLTYTYIENCIFLNNTQYAIEAVGVFGLDRISISSTTFYSINSINILNTNYISISNSNFYYSNNTPSIDQQQCPVLLDMISNGQIINSTINTAICIYHSTNITGDSLVFSNQPSSINIQAALLLLGSSINLTNIDFSPKIIYSCISAFECQVNMDNSILNTTGSKNSIIIEDTELSMKDVQFISDSIVATKGKITGYNITALDATFLTTSSVQSIYFYNSNFTSVTMFLVSSEIHTFNCTFMDGYDDVFQMISSMLFDQDSYITNNTISFVSSTGATSVVLNGTIIVGNSFNSLIELGNSGAVIVYNIQFLSNNAWGSGCAFSLSEQTYLQVYNSEFRNNFCSGFGGIVNAPASSTVLLKDCIVSNNSGDQNGGVIYSAGQNNITIDGGFYLDNILKNGSLGTFIFYYDTPPLIKPNVIYDHKETIVLGKIYIHLTQDFSQIQSGSGPHILGVSFINDKGVKLNNYEFDKSSRLYISLTGSGVLEDISLYKLPTINGTYFVYFDQLIGQINSSQTVFVSSDSPYIISNQFGFQFLPCPQGYYPNERNTLCLLCPYGTYGINSQCLTCPQNAICYGGSLVAGLNGYWVYTNGSNLKVYECPTDVCYQNDITRNTTCAPFSDGILCADCIDGYYNCGSGCKKETSINKFVLVIKIIMFFILVITQQWSSDNSGLITIALYFMQTLAVISSGIKFSILTNLSGSNTAHSGRSNSILSVLNDCLGPFGFYWNHYFILLQPIFLFIVLLFIIILELLLRKTGIIYKIPFVKEMVEKSNKEFFNRQFSTFIKVCMNSYGPFATEVLLILFCEDIGPLELLNANPAVSCSGAEYDNAKKITFGLISILVLFPFLIFILLYRIKNRLDDKDIERIYGVFYLKYIPKLYYWDVTLLLKRLSIVTVSLIQFQSNYRSVLLVILALIYLFVHLKFQPFISDQDNNLETVSLILLFISCIYLDNGLYQDTEQWILIICVVSFLLAAIKFQSKYLMNEFNTKIYPILKKIYGKFNSATSSSNVYPDQQYKVSYDYEESDNEDDEISNYAYDSQRNVIKVIDKKSNYYNFSDISINSSSPSNQLSSSYTYGDEDSDNDDFISNQVKRRI